MMVVPTLSPLKAKRRKRSAKPKRREPTTTTTTQSISSSSKDMEEIHLKRRILDHHSELLLTWWDDSKNQQEGLLISCKCKNDCPSSTPDSATTSSTITPSTSSPNGESDSILYREKLFIRSAPFVSKLMDSSCSGVALYNDANSLDETSPTSNMANFSQPRVINIQPSPTVSRMEVNPPSMIVANHDENWRNKRPYPCDYCGKPFRTSYEKRRHEMIHTGDRPWKCTECNKAFVDRACLRNHMKKRHLGEKPYKCAFCDITFFDTMNRAKHQRTHEERQKAIKQEREAMLQVKQEQELQVTQGDPTVAIVQVEEQLRQELMHTSEQLGVVTQDEEVDEDHKDIKVEHTNESNDVEMADVFNITVIPDQSVTLSVSDMEKVAS